VKKAQKAMTADEEAAFHNEHDGYNKGREVEGNIFEPFLDQG